MILQESAQMYLENVLILENRLGEVRSIDLAEEMGFSKPSVSRAVHLLVDNGFLTMEADGRLLLTESGRIEAIGIYQRHVVLSHFLMALGVDPAIADDDACRIEHIISTDTFERVKVFLREHQIDFPEANEKDLFYFAENGVTLKE